MLAIGKGNPAKAAILSNFKLSSDKKYSTEAIVKG
jgi:hypothetical protein